jgi:glycosyltransferase involved in cell wall biosynthesis
LRFFWFSQTIGQGRGIELIIDALNDFDKPFELHLLGKGIDSFVMDCEHKAQFKKGKLIFHTPIPPDEIFGFCSHFDIGLCLEKHQPLNRNICLTNKVFTYLQAGLAVIASDTRAQKAFLTENTGIGNVFKDKIDLLDIIKNYDADRELLNQHKTNSFILGQTTFNWEIEQQKFLPVIKQTLSN